MLNKIKQTIKQTTINTAKLYGHMYTQLSEYKGREVLGTTRLGNKTVILVHDDMQLLGVASVPAAATYRRSIQFSSGVSTRYYVVVNTLWRGLDSKHKAAILAHELGHIQAGHVDHSHADMVKANIGRLCGSKAALDRELEADMVAVEAGYGKALYAVLAYINTCIPSKELESRKKALLEQL